jgi:hypothetical protein
MRKAALVWLALAFGLQLAERGARRLYTTPGDPPLAEALASLPRDSPVLWRADLGDAPRRPDGATRLVALPEAWGAEPPFLLVFVDGLRVPFARVGPDPAQAAGAHAYYRSLERVPQLAIACPPAAACRSLVAIAERPALEWAVAAQRAAANPGLLAMGALALAAWLSLLLMAYRQWGAHGWALASLLAALSLVPWLALDTAASRLAEPLIGYELIALAAAVVVSRRGLSAEAWGAWLASGLAASLMVPVLLTPETYLTDWANHLYYSARQLSNLRELARPGYFVHSDATGVLYPYFAFYAGSAYVATALLGWFAGSIALAYRISHLLALAAAYGGAAWLARQLGLGSWRAHLPALALASSAYYLTLPYGRGAWGELLAVSSIPLLLASVVAMLRSERSRRRDRVLAFAAALVWSGSHTITLVWGSVFLGALCVWLVVARVVPLRRGLPRQALRAAALVACGIAANAWFLAPLLAYGRSTEVAGYGMAGFGSRELALASPAVWLLPWRSAPGASGDIYVQLPVYILAWTVVALACRWRHGLSPELRRLAVGLLALLVAFLLLVSSDRDDLAWAVLPAVLRVVQFQFRLHSYVLFAAAGLLALGLVAAASSRAAARWQTALLLALCAELGLAQYQVWTAPGYLPIEQVASAGVVAPRTLAYPQDYRFTSHPASAQRGEAVFAGAMPGLDLDPARVRGERAEGEAPAGLGPGPLRLNVPFSPFVRACGDAPILGRTADGWTVVELPRGSALRVCVEGTLPPPARLGVAVSLLALLAGVALIVRR